MLVSLHAGTLVSAKRGLHQRTQAELARMRLACLNRARERRKLRVYLCEWAPLQDLFIIYSLSIHYLFIR